jgi:DNA-directed RNA polymerase subunit RPC12/RpoP
MIGDQFTVIGIDETRTLRCDVCGHDSGMPQGWKGQHGHIYIGYRCGACVAHRAKNQTPKQWGSEVKQPE